MTDYQLPFEHKKISFAYIDEQQRLRALLPANPELKDIVAALFMAGGFGKAVNQDLLSEAMYEFAPARPKTVFSEQEDTRRARRGRFRLENILRKTQLTHREVEVFHKAFRHALGDAIADRIGIVELVAMRFVDFRRLLLDMAPEIPETASIELRLQLLAARTEAKGLQIAPAFVNAGRLGLAPGSKWQEASTVLDLPLHPVDSAFVLDVSGLQIGEDLLILEAARDPVALAGGHTGQLFPAALLQTSAVGMEIETPRGPFVTGKAHGVFTYFAFAGILTEALRELEGMDLSGVPLSDVNARHIIGLLEGSSADAGSTIRIASYPYRVSG